MASMAPTTDAGIAVANDENNNHVTHIFDVNSDNGERTPDCVQVHNKFTHNRHDRTAAVRV
jgi:hypothetical protein